MMSESQCNKVILEIILTEETYLKQLRTLEKFFVRPCLEKSLLPEHIHSVIFGELAALQCMNEELYKTLVSENENVGTAFLHLAPFLKVYSSYAKNYQQAISLLLEWERRSNRFRSWLIGTESRPEVQAKLPSLLITPVQRIPRYRLLLNELLKCTPSEHPHHSNIANAVKEMSEVAEHINHSVYKAESLQRMLMIQRAFKQEQFNIIAPGRHLLKEGILHKVSRSGKSSQPRLIFLFSDILLYTKLPSVNFTGTSTSSSGDFLDVDYKPGSLECCCLLPLRHCSIISVLGNGHQGLFRIKCESEDMLLYGSEKIAGRDWVSALTDAIQQAVEKRRTLRKDSSSRKPLRRPALRKLTIKGDPEHLIPLKVKKPQDENSEEPTDPSRSDSPKASKGRATNKKTQRLPSSLMTQLIQVQECLTPPKSWLSPNKKQKSTEESLSDQGVAGKFKRPHPVVNLLETSDGSQKKPKKRMPFIQSPSGDRKKEEANSCRVTRSQTLSRSPQCTPNYKPSPLAR